MKVFELLSGANAISTGISTPLIDEALTPPYSYQATVVGVGAVSATVVFEVSNDRIGWMSDASSTVTLSGSGSATGGFSSVGPWAYVRARLTAINGTGALVTATIGG